VTTNNAQPHIVVANDDVLMLDLMKELLTDEGYQVTLIRESRKAYQLIKELAPDLVILDIRMGNELTGFELIALLMLDPATRRIPLIVASADSRALQEHADQLAHHNILVVAKPFDLEDLLKAISEQRVLSGARDAGRQCD
jgi:CheY-like chemotaxis protein